MCWVRDVLGVVEDEGVAGPRTVGGWSPLGAPTLLSTPSTALRPPLSLTPVPFTAAARFPVLASSKDIAPSVPNGAATAQSGLAWRRACRAATLE